MIGYTTGLGLSNDETVANAIVSLKKALNRFSVYLACAKLSEEPIYAGDAFKLIDAKMVTALQKVGNILSDAGAKGTDLEEMKSFASLANQSFTCKFSSTSDKSIWGMCYVGFAVPVPINTAAIAQWTTLVNSYADTLKPASCDATISIDDGGSGSSSGEDKTETAKKSNKTIWIAGGLVALFVGTVIYLKVRK